ncbi:MAG TPA: helix-turn-helix transcriptional regulator [Bacteroidales bacterium]|nr:helix-turn-helix transcriptional regulator [Bacteroidales bacterium]
MKERILALLKEKQISATKLADIIDVQRSSISHLLSGRNKPSFDFIEKILRAYPDLDAQWLITGKGEMYTHQKSLFDEDIQSFVKPKDLTSGESHIQNKVDDDIELKKSETDKSNLSSDKNKEKIERIVIFYLDGKFKEYKP